MGKSGVYYYHDYLYIYFISCVCVGEWYGALRLDFIEDYLYKTIVHIYMYLPFHVGRLIYPEVNSVLGL